MKIAIFTDTYVPQTNGVVAYLTDLIRILARENEVVLFAPGEGHFRYEKADEKFSIYWIPSSPFPFYEGYRIASMNYKRISGLLKREMPDIVHAHAPVNLGLQGILSAKRKKIPIVITYHTHFPDYVPHLLKGRLPGVFGKITEHTVKRLIRHVFSMADVVTAPTQELVDELASYGLRNVVYLPNGIDLDNLGCSRKELSDFRKSHRSMGGKKVVLYLGRISFEKKLDHLIRAFKLSEKKDRVLMIAGGGPYIKKFRDFALKMGAKNVLFTGFVKNKGAAYLSADVFASASDSETFGLTYVEAMHFGLPVIGVRRLGAKEVIIHGKTGLLVEPGDISGLAGAMERLLKDKRLREKLGKAGRIQSKKYSIENSVRRTLRIYRNLAGKR
jgi:glycosyltransferase involved in cell wall biosynthesis